MCEWKHYVHFMLIWDALCKELMSFTFSSYAPAFLHLFLSFALSAQPALPGDSVYGNVLGSELSCKE